MGGVRTLRIYPLYDDHRSGSWDKRDPGPNQSVFPTIHDLRVLYRLCWVDGKGGPEVFIYTGVTDTVRVVSETGKIDPGLCTKGTTGTIKISV